MKLHKRGGRREGAGRPEIDKKARRVTVALMLTDRAISQLEKMGMSRGRAADKLILSHGLGSGLVFAMGALKPLSIRLSPDALASLDQAAWRWCMSRSQAANIIFEGLGKTGQ